MELDVGSRDERLLLAVGERHGQLLAEQRVHRSRRQSLLAIGQVSELAADGGRQEVDTRCEIEAERGEDRAEGLQSLPQEQGELDGQLLYLTGRRGAALPHPARLQPALHLPPPGFGPLVRSRPPHRPYHVSLSDVRA
jgi:hypothetical protein